MHSLRLISGIQKFVLLSLFSISLQAATLSISPTAPMAGDFVTAIVDGNFSSSGWGIQSNISNQTGNHFDISVDKLAPNLITLPFSSPFTETIDLGNLAAGDYSITANIYTIQPEGFIFPEWNIANRVLDETLNLNFTVTSEVPLPPAAGLFAAALLGLFRAKRR